ncbi:MAG: PaaI family thioesterase [Euryarchaeota archaeon]|nr:PaaI family thioesterase [Euryarchaeota archaeon]
MIAELGSFLAEEVRDRLQRIMDVPFVKDLGIETVSISEDGEVRCVMDAGDKINAMGGAHGGAMFTLADQAFAIASNLGKEPQVALVASINYIRPGKGMLEAVARRTSDTRRTSLYEVRVFDDGELVAVFQGTGYKIGGKRPASSP